MQDLSLLLASPVAFHRIFAKIAGGATAGLFLSQLYYWSQNQSSQDRDGWFYKSMEEWEDETALTRCEQETARRRLRELGLLDEVRKGMPARLWFHLNMEKLYELANLLYAGNQQSSMRETIIQDCGKSAIMLAATSTLDCGKAPDLIAEKPHPLYVTETTNRDYTEKTQRESEASPPRVCATPPVVAKVPPVEGEVIDAAHRFGAEKKPPPTLKEVLARQPAPSVYKTTAEFILAVQSAYPKPLKGNRRVMLIVAQEIECHLWDRVVKAAGHYALSDEVKRGVVMKVESFLDGDRWMEFEEEPKGRNGGAKQDGRETKDDKFSRITGAWQSRGSVYPFENGDFGTYRE